MSVEIGQEAPDFELKSTVGDPIALSSFRGAKPVALVFFPFAFSGICTTELCELRDDLSRYEDAGVQVLAISCNATHAQKAWAAQEGYEFPILSDFWPHGAVAQAYGVFNDALGCATRSTFLIGTDGTVVDEFHTDAIGTARDQARYTEALAKL